MGIFKAPIDELYQPIESLIKLKDLSKLSISFIEKYKIHQTDFSLPTMRVNLIFSILLTPSDTDYMKGQPFLIASINAPIGMKSKSLRSFRFSMREKLIERYTMAEFMFYLTKKDSGGQWVGHPDFPKTFTPEEEFVCL
jgi:hypothetical protein